MRRTGLRPKPPADHRAAGIEVTNSELRTIREGMRELHKMIDALEAGEAAKVVLCTGTRMRAVLVSLDAYVELVRED